LHQLTDDEFAEVHPSLDGGVREVLTVSGALSSRITLGGTAPVLVTEQIKVAQLNNDSHAKKIADKQQAFSEMMGA